MESLIVLIWMDCSIARILSRIFPTPIKITNYWIHKVTQTQCQSTINILFSTNKQIHARKYFTHTKTQNTHIHKCLCTLRHSADLFVYIFTCSLVRLLCFLVCTCISAFWIDVCGRDGKVRERKQTIYLLKHWLILLFGIYCECLMAYRLWPSLFMIFFPSVICLRHSIVYNIAHWCILLAHFDHFTQ